MTLPIQGGALLAAGALGALFAEQAGIPAGVIIGALLGSGLYRVAGGEPGPWRDRYGRVGRLLLGTVIGAAFGPEVLEPLKSALLPMLVLILIMVGAGFGLGWALAHFTPLDVTTALLSSVPGGLPAMVAFADDVAADATVVAAIHFSRLTTILLLMPALVPLLAQGSGGAGEAISLAAPVGFGTTVVILAGGGAGALLAARGGLPTSDLIGPLMLVGGVNLLGAGPNPLAPGLRTAAMLLIGISVGAQMSRESLRLLRQVALPAAALVAVLIGAGLILGWGLSQTTSLDRASALLSSVPGGASTMPAVAHDLGGDMRLVAALHFTRQLILFILLPPLLSHLLRRGHDGRVRLVEQR